MVPGAEFWQTQDRMQNAPEAGAGTSISASPIPNTVSAQSDPPAGSNQLASSDVPAGRAAPASPVLVKPPEIGGPAGPEPTRYGDWEKKGRCIDF